MHEPTTPDSGGAAPPHRQCQYIKGNGRQCRDWTLRGQPYCCRHGRYARTRASGPIEVPLIEDEATLALVLSQTVRALARGTIPQANGRAILSGCRLMHAIFAQRLDTAKFRAGLRRMGLSPDEISGFLDDAPAPEPPDTPEEPDRNLDPDRDRQSAPPLPAQQTGSDPDASSSPDPQPAGAPPLSAQQTGWENDPPSSPEPAPQIDPDPAEFLSAQPRFRDLRTSWDRALQRAENEVADVYLPRPGESHQERLTHLATPFDHLTEPALCTP